jgi:hypothetical protein
LIVVRSALARLFADDPLAAVLQVLREAGDAAELRASQVKAALRTAGVPEEGLRAWPQVQARLVGHERVRLGGDRHRRTYRYAAEPVVKSGGAAHSEQREKELVRALAEMAIEVEELAVNEASARALVHTVRALAKVAQLRPIERAGETARFDRGRHASVGGPITAGAPVLVLRPGYVWDREAGEILIARAVVQDRSQRP